MSAAAVVWLRCGSASASASAPERPQHALPQTRHGASRPIAVAAFGRRHDVDRPAARLAQDAADIFADDAEHEELPGAEHRDHRHDRGPAGDRVADPQEADDRVDQQQHADRREYQRKMDREPQRLDAVRDDSGHGEIDHPAQCEARRALLPHALHVRDGRERKAEPAHQPAQEHVLVFQRVDDVDGGAVEQHEVGAARLDMHVAERVEHAVEQPRGRLLGGGVLAALVETPRDHDLRAALPFLPPVAPRLRADARNRSPSRSRRGRARGAARRAAPPDGRSCA